jgi:tRNA A-37 threonylcarbamoyl transferase component Bud32
VSAGLVLFFLISLSLAVLAQPDDTPSAKVHQVRIVTKPDDANLYIDVSGRHHYEKFIGRSNSPVLLDLTPFRDSSGINLIIRRDGYFDKTERIAIGYFDTRDVYPEMGAIRLEPQHWTVPIRVALIRYQLPLLGLTLLLFSGGWWLARVLRKVRPVSSLASGPPLSGQLQKRFGDYTLVAVAGVGASGTVYKGLPFDTSDPKKAVAVKVFSQEVVEAPDFSERFQREAGIYRTLQHPGIVPLLDWGQIEGMYYLATEYVDGSPLTELMMARTFEPTEVVNILLQVSEALQYAHDLGVIHRDVKPGNVLLDASGKAHLIDFGLARQVMSSFTRTGQAMGTPAYMSPEQIKGTFVDHRCDQYALGALAYHLLSGRSPFETEENDPAPILYRQVNQDPPPLREFVPAVSEKLESLVARLMQRGPEDRFPNMIEVSKALRLLS